MVHGGAAIEQLTAGFHPGKTTTTTSVGFRRSPRADILNCDRFKLDRKYLPVQSHVSLL